MLLQGVLAAVFSVRGFGAGLFHPLPSAASLQVHVFHDVSLIKESGNLLLLDS